MVEIDVPADQVQPVPGTSYGDVPKLPSTAHARTARTRPGLVVDRGAVQTRPRPGTGLTIRIHHPGCEATAGAGGGTLTTEEARWMITHDPIASACGICTAHETLVGPKL